MEQYFKPRPNGRIVQFLLIISWLSLIAAFLLTPMEPTGGDINPWTIKDKILHLWLFGVLSWLIAAWLKKYTDLKLASNWLIALVTVSGYSLLVEYLQTYITGRSESWLDWSAGLLGAAIAWSLWIGWEQKKDRRPTLLLHMCCGPCGSFLSGQLAKDYQVTLFFHNPNIDNRAEFKLRAKQAVKVAEYWGLPAIIDNYKHAAWLKSVTGLESQPEGGSRCAKCFQLRLLATASLAKRRGFTAFATSLSVSPHKSYALIRQAGQQAAAKYGVDFMEQDFKKRDGYKLSITQAKKIDLYRQDYCGCEFSRNKKSGSVSRKSSKQKTAYS